MSENLEMTSSIGAFLPSLPQPRSHAAVAPVRGPSRNPLHLKATVRAGAFLLLNLAAYVGAGYLGMAFFKWAWYRFVG